MTDRFAPPTPGAVYSFRTKFHGMVQCGTHPQEEPDLEIRFCMDRLVQYVTKGKRQPPGGLLSIGRQHGELVVLWGRGIDEVLTRQIRTWQHFWKMDHPELERQGGHGVL